MAVVAGADDGERVYLKGAPGRVLEMCSTQGTLDDHEELDRDRWEELIDELSNEGLRVLAAAVREGDSLDEDDPGMGGTTLAIFLSLYDGSNIEVARTMTVNVLVLVQAFYLFNVRVLNGSVLRPSVLFSNWVAWASVGALVAFQWAWA
ncbi:cation transporting ATPase C-terminal domain-containing protein [Tessaracoccus massiliensis]|uniref:cation transporting ATPase C-terminal domain-containing protein n=1 Tax=Tessaracoccus massiliensis TaxID=1522311 RepID=UPI00058E7170|nr:cation transporting ATPase C-terminal domain-containing protein [Tessaracoccus massiliensis]